MDPKRGASTHRKDDMSDKQKDLFGFKPVAELLPKVERPKPPSRVQRRAIETGMAIALDPPEVITYQHTVLCQSSMPYRDPGPQVREWEREQGAVALRVEAGAARNPETDEWVPLGLPFGPKPRLILAYLNAEALKTGSPVIEMEGSLTAFVRRVQGRNPTGPEISKFKDHLGRLAAATIRMAIAREGRAIQVDSKIVTAFDLWFPKNENQRVLWPSTVHLSLDYFGSLQKHAVPLDERALAGLSHSALALDIYAWLAQRLHRIPKRRPQFITWAAIKDQFGPDFGRMDNFKRKFRAALAQILTQYPTAKIEADGYGVTLRHSLPPVTKRMVLVHK